MAPCYPCSSANLREIPQEHPDPKYRECSTIPPHIDPLLVIDVHGALLIEKEVDRMSILTVHRPIECSLEEQAFQLGSDLWKTIRRRFLEHILGK